MSTRARYHPRNLDVDLATCSRDLYAEIVSLHGQIPPPPAPPVLTCLGNGQPMYVVRHENGRFFARHYANGNPDKHHHVIATMSDEHLRQAEYTRRAAASSGLDATLERSTGNGTRLDLAVSGKLDIGFEVQRSSLSRVAAKTRAFKSFQAGWPTAWITDNPHDPDWADHVPTARLTTREAWSQQLPPPNTARVVIGQYIRERERRSKTGWRYKREPRAVLLDEIAYLMPAGEIVPVAIGAKGRVDLAFTQAIDVIDSCTYPGASKWFPAPNTPRNKEAAQRFTKVCGHSGLAIPCRICGQLINAVFGINAHYDCARKERERHV